jgi:TPR repeat protein
VTLLHESTPTDTSKAKALRLLQASADDGRSEAIRFLGRAYLEGILIPADFTKAFQLFRYGKDLGCQESLHRLAECYLRGTGVESDIHEAVRLLKESTKSGHPFSPFVLGSLYLEGTKVPQDISLGRDLLKLSASRRCAIAAAQLAQFFLWNPAYATIGYERQAYAVIAGELGDKSQSDELKSLKLDEIPELMKSVKLIKSITPNPTF